MTTRDAVLRRARDGVIAGSRGLVQAIASLLPGIPLIVFSLLSVVFLVLGVGVLVAPPILLTLRAFANQQRRWARDWSGVAITRPYRPRPPDSTTGLIGRLQVLKWLLNDPATWRDLWWVTLNIAVGVVLGMLSILITGYGVFGLLVLPWLPAVVGDWSPFYLFAIPVGALLIPVGLRAAPMLLGAHARFCRWLLAPAEPDLAARVGQLTETRAQVVDASAAELRRIERDLHDGAQARLAALGMNIGLAEQMLRDDPDAALALLVEARESSGQALTELRDLVRGIHPPVLAERGLDGAIRALALTLPLPVDVQIEIDGRMSAPVESATYFAVAEALANVVKHSHATCAWIRVRHEHGSLVAMVGDDGVGGAQPGSGDGLRGIEKRLAAFDGTIFVASPAGGPTIVTLEIPCELSSART